MRTAILVRRVVTAAASAALLLSGLSVAAPPANASDAGSRPQLPVTYSFFQGVLAALADPLGSPPGANDWTCTPSAEHPLPVILLHGILGNAATNNQAISPYLYNQGYCVYALTYGADPSGLFGGLGRLHDSAAQLDALVDKVRVSTGAAKVDLVGHSEGGLLGRYYTILGGGAGKVDAVVGVAPANFINGQQALTPPWDLLFQLVVDAVGPTVPVLNDFTPKSFEAMSANGGTAAGVRYVSIASEVDLVVTPISNSFLPAAPNVTNVTLQKGCPIDHADHTAMMGDRRVFDFVANALDPVHPRTPACTTVYPFT